MGTSLVRCLPRHEVGGTQNLVLHWCSICSLSGASRAGEPLRKSGARNDSDRTLVCVAQEERPSESDGLSDVVQLAFRRVA